MKEEVHDNCVLDKPDEDAIADMKQKTAIEVSDVNAKWQYSSSDLTLINMNFTIYEGQIVGVIGSVGSGKVSVNLKQSNIYFTFVWCYMKQSVFHVKGKWSFAQSKSKYRVLQGLLTNRVST